MDLVLSFDSCEATAPHCIMSNNSSSNKSNNNDFSKHRVPVPDILNTVFQDRHTRHDVNRYWHFICRAQPSAMNWYKTNNNDKTIDDKVKKSLKEMRNWFKNRNNNTQQNDKGKGKGKGDNANNQFTTKGKGKGKGKGKAAINVDDCFFPQLHAFTSAASGMVAEPITKDEASLLTLHC